MTKITKLTPEQESELPVFREHWRAIGLSTEPCDKEKAIASVKNLYAAAGLSEPRVLFFCSPLLCLWARGLLMKMGEKKLEKDQLWDRLEDQLWAQLRDQLGDQLRDQLGAQLRDQLEDRLEDQLGGQLRDQLEDQLEDQLGGQLWGQLRDQLEAQLWDQLWDQNLYEPLWTIGGMDAFWLSFYEFGRKIGVKYTCADHFDAYLQYAQNAGIMFAYDGIALISDRPEVLRFDNERRLHCENGPAVRFRDGWSVHAWHGQRVPAEWIESPETLTAKVALTWENIEQRRAACEILGWNNVLKELNAKEIDADGDPQIGRLLEVDIPEIGKERFLQVLCGTGREFALPVPPDMRTALEAQAWTWGMDSTEFTKPEIRT